PSSSTTAVPGGGPPGSGARTGCPLSAPVCGAPTKRKYAAAPPSSTPSRSVSMNFIRVPLVTLATGRGRRRSRGRGAGRRLLVDEGHQHLQPLRELRDPLLDLLGRELPVALRQLEVGRVDIRLQLARLDDAVAARDALDVTRRLAEALDTQGEPRLLIDVDVGLALDLPGGGLRLRAACSA